MKRLKMIGVLAAAVTAFAFASTVSVTLTHAGAIAVAEAKGKTSTGIEWQVNPDAVIIFLDGKRVGQADKLRGKVSKTRPGKHTVKLTNGKDETEMDIQVKKGQTLKFTFVFDAG